jgi:predicted nucleic acid-binding protein
MLLTSDYIIDETLTRIRYDSGHGKAVEFLDIINESIGKGFLVMKRIDERIWEEAATIFRKYDKSKLSFTDCTSFSLARKWNVSKILAFDDDFRMMGFEVIP